VLPKVARQSIDLAAEVSHDASVPQMATAFRLERLLDLLDNSAGGRTHERCRVARCGRKVITVLASPHDCAHSVYTC
jgi:hypothetical protein